MINRCVLLVWLCAGLSAQESPKTVDGPWQPLRLLIGTWDAKTQGGSANAVVSGSYTFQLELGGNLLARHTAFTMERREEAA